MRKNLVTEWMTRDVVTIGPKTSLIAARQLLNAKHIRHLPVVEKGRLIGIVTSGDIREASASDATSLSVYELNYLLRGLTVDQFMTRNVITVSPDNEVYEAATLMLECRIGGLPVVADEKLVGIITETDIFRLFIDEATGSRIPATPLGVPLPAAA